MEKGDRILVSVTGIQNYGVFVEYQNYQGLIHISEISDYFVSDVQKLFGLGDLIYATILEIDNPSKKLQLSYKRAQLIDSRVAKQVDIKIGFRSIQKKFNEWILEQKGDMK